MKLFLISQRVNNDYDTYSDAVVIAENEDDAKRIHPNGYAVVGGIEEQYSGWCGLSDVSAEYIGEAKEGSERGVVCASFHAG